MSMDNNSNIETDQEYKFPNLNCKLPMITKIGFYKFIIPYKTHKTDQNHSQHLKTINVQSK